MDSQTLQTYAPVGTCGTTCQYQAITITCADGCDQTSCFAGSATYEHLPFNDGSNLYRYALAVDALDQPHLAYCENNGQVHYRHRNASGWTDETVDVPVGSGCAVVLDLGPGGVPRLAYHDSNNVDLRYAERGPNGFVIQTLLHTGDMGQAPSMTHDAQGEPVIVSFGQNTMRGAFVSRRAGGTWTTEAAVSLPGVNIPHPMTSVLFDAQGVLHVLVGPVGSAGEFATTEALTHASFNGSWVTRTAAASGYASRRGFVLDALGNPLVAYGIPAGSFTAGKIHIARLLPGSIQDSYVKDVYSGFDYPTGFTDAPANPALILRIPSSLYREDVPQSGDWNLAFGSLNHEVMDLAPGPSGAWRYQVFDYQNTVSMFVRP